MDRRLVGRGYGLSGCREQSARLDSKRAEAMAPKRGPFFLDISIRGTLSGQFRTQKIEARRIDHLRAHHIPLLLNAHTGR